MGEARLSIETVTPAVTEEEGTRMDGDIDILSGADIHLALKNFEKETRREEKQH